MSFVSLDIPDVKVFSLKKFGDDRGYFSETYSEKLLQSAGINVRFVQDNQSLSKEKGIIRGLHMQAPPFDQAKLVRVNRGRILDVCVDVRRSSPTYGNWVAAEISEQAWNQIYVPSGFLHGFVTLEEDTEVHYKVSNFYDRNSEGGVIWNDPTLAIDWPLDRSPILSEKDQLLPKFADFETPFA